MLVCVNNLSIYIRFFIWDIKIEILVISYGFFFGFRIGKLMLLDIS